MFSHSCYHTICSEISTVLPAAPVSTTAMFSHCCYHMICSEISAALPAAPVSTTAMFSHCCYRTICSEISAVLPAALVSTTPYCHFWPMGAWISGSGTIFSWMDDVLLTHVQGVVIQLSSVNIIWPKSVNSGRHSSC